MTAHLRFPYIHIAPAQGNAGWMPFMPLTLTRNGTDLTASALIDSGAAVNLLPFDIGVRLGLDWNQVNGFVPLSGLLASYPAKPVILDAVVGTFPPLRLAFGWTQAPNVRLLLGQTNFFMSFDICFCRARQYFEVSPATAATP